MLYIVQKCALYGWPTDGALSTNWSSALVTVCVCKCATWRSSETSRWQHSSFYCERRRRRRHCNVEWKLNAADVIIGPSLLHCTLLSLYIDDPRCFTFSVNVLILLHLLYSYAECFAKGFVALWVKKVGGAEICIFLTSGCKFWQSTLWLLRITILPLISTIMTT